MYTPSNGLITFDFHGDALEGLRGPDGRPMIVLRRVCDALGLDFASQWRRLQGQPWATIVMMTTVGEDGRAREMCCADRQTLLMWLATLNSLKVASRVRPKLVLFQKEVASFVDRVFGDGGAVGRVGAADFGGVFADRMLAQVELMAESQRQILALVTPLITRMASVEGLAEEALRRATGVVARVEAHSANPGLLVSTRTIGDGSIEGRQARAHLTMRLRDLATHRGISMNRAVGALRQFGNVHTYKSIRLDALPSIHAWFDSIMAQPSTAPIAPPAPPVRPSEAWTIFYEMGVADCSSDAPIVNVPRGRASKSN